MNWIVAFNALWSGLYDALVGVARPAGSIGQLALIGAVMGGMVTVVFKRLVDRQRMRRDKRRLQAALYESWLYRHQPRVVLSANGALLVANFAYLWTFLWPVLFASLLATPLALQVYYHFGLQQPQAGESALLTAEFASESVDTMTISGDPEIVAITPPVRLPAQARIVWRVTRLREGATTIELRQGSQLWSLPLEPARRSLGMGLYRDNWDLLITPRAGALDADANLVRVWFDYDLAPLDWLGWLTLASAGGAMGGHWVTETIRRRGAGARDS